MIADNERISVRNRSYGTVGYKLPELGITRKFQKNETKQITMDELRKLSYQPGGQILINESLVIESKEALKELNPNYEPEYFYSEADVERILLTASMDEFSDCLDFAPQGVIDLMRVKAVELEIADIRKRDAIFKKTGFDINRQIMNQRLAKEEEKEEPPAKQRRVALVEEKKEAAPTRRTAAPEEKVVQEAPVTSRYKIKNS